jgi:predicted CopG family antitoxin
MHIISDMYRRITVGLRQEVYTKLRDRGKFGESFSDVVLRIIEEANKNTTLEGEERVS